MRDQNVNYGREYQQCSISLMDTIGDPDITFDENGISNYYHDYIKLEKEYVFRDEEGRLMLQEMLDKIKENGEGKKYDCITGVSGGVDSSYLTLMAKKWGLRTLLVHFDNGWDTEIAVSNINNIIKETGFDFYTIVVNWEEFKDLQLSYLKASVVDIEVPTDHAISGTLQKLAVKYNIKYILSGNNVVTEAVLPKSWIYDKGDYVNLLNIHKKFGSVPLKSYPLFGFKEQFYYGIGKGIETVKPLNYINFNKDHAKETIIRELGWKDYGGKHHESIFTKFFQGYILPYKFNIDKRKAHLSNLIFSKQMTKEDALIEIENPIYDAAGLQTDMQFVLKKFGLSVSEFENIMRRPRVEHSIYGKQQSLTHRYPVLRLLKPFKKLIYKSANK